MLNVTFLAHSGFLVDDGKRCYVFDYYKDPNNIENLYHSYCLLYHIFINTWQKNTDTLRYITIFAIHHGYCTND